MLGKGPCQVNWWEGIEGRGSLGDSLLGFGLAVVELSFFVSQVWSRGIGKGENGPSRSEEMHSLRRFHGSSQKASRMEPSLPFRKPGSFHGIA